MTANSGYLQRRIVKLVEDIQTQYDGTIRDTSGRIYQTTYGDDGYDPCATVKVNGTQEAADVSRLVSCLNLRHEMGILDEE